MDVVISGSSGLIGRALASSLLADGHRVLRLRRGGITDGDDVGWNPEAGRIDAPALEGVDAVVHLAGEGIGEHKWTDEQKRRIRDSRVRGTAVIAVPNTEFPPAPDALDLAASVITSLEDLTEERITTAGSR